MMIFKKIILQFILLLVLGSLFDINAQNNIQLEDCETEALQPYVDSLDQLIIRFLPEQIISLSDSLLQEHNNPICPLVIQIKAARAYGYEHLYKYEIAIEIYNDLLKTVLANRLIEEEIIIKTSLARVYETINRPDICEQYLNEVEKLFESHENDNLLSNYYVRAASYHRIYKDKYVAKQYAHKAIDLGKEIGRLVSVAGGYLILGVISENIDESIENFKKSSHYYLEANDFQGYLFQELNIAKLYYRKKDYTESLAIVNALSNDIEKGIENKKHYYQQKAYVSELKSNCYEGLGNRDSLIVSLKETNKYSNLFGEITNQEKINQLLVDNSVEKEQQKVQVANKLNRFLSLSLLGLLGVVLLLLRYYLNDKRKGKQIKEQSSTIRTQFIELEKLYNYQTVLLSEVHHRIKNNLQLIISLLTLQKVKLGNNIDSEILDMLNFRITSISLIHEQLYSLKEFEKVDVGLYVRDLIKNFKNFIIDRKVNIEFDIDDLSLNLETIIPLGLIWSELISNSLKYNLYLDELKIYFELSKQDEFYVMKYRDNGIGYPEGLFKGSEKGMGFTIVNSLTRQLSAESKSFNNEGAHYTMKFQQKTISPL